jgi:hypothetical protein
MIISFADRADFLALPRNQLLNYFKFRKQNGMFKINENKISSYFDLSIYGFKSENGELKRIRESVKTKKKNLRNRSIKLKVAQRITSKSFPSLLKNKPFSYTNECFP